MKNVTPTELRRNIYQLIDEVLKTGIPIEIDRNGRKLLLTPVEPVDKLKNLPYRPHIINGDPEDLVDLSWEDVVDLDLP